MVSNKVINNILGKKLKHDKWSRNTTEEETFEEFLKRIAEERGINPENFYKFWNARGFPPSKNYYVAEWANRIKFGKWEYADNESLRLLKKHNLYWE